MQQALHRSSLVPRGFVVESACYEGDKAIITVRASGSVALCPSCGTVSTVLTAHLTIIICAEGKLGHSVCVSSWLK